MIVCECRRAPWLPPCQHVRAEMAEELWRRVEFQAPPDQPDDQEDDGA